ncbi:glycosyltransferase family 4 protein [Candidatus Woesearchaeota archaeon]|nr:glycosyltransferase family 4 protein [Candidatus Woesearchaeota archaeon]
MRKAVIVVSYDGITSQYCGVGTITNMMITALDLINKDKPQKERIDLFAITSAISSNCLGFSGALKKQTESILKKNNGKLYFLNSFKDNRNQYGDDIRWRKNSMEVFLILKEISDKYDKLIVFLHDAPFIGVAKYSLKRELNNVNFVWVPHSSGYLHGKNQKERQKRINWERENILNNKKFFIGCISEYMRDHLFKNYQVNKEVCLPLTNGIIFKKELNKKESRPCSIKIPKNKKLVLGFGRSEPYKNLLSILKASKYLNKDYFVLIIASNLTSDNPQNKLLMELSLSLDNCKVIPYYLPREKIKNLIENNQTIVVVPSLKEPFGMIPVETRLWGVKSNSIVLVSKYGGLKEQISENKDGFLINSFNPKRLAYEIMKIGSLSQKKKEEISKNGFKTIRSKYDYVNNLRNFLSSFNF